MADIGTLIFSEMLGMTMYPGQPFTGNIYRDIIMFLIVPTIFIISILYIMTGRVLPNGKFRLMIGVGAYLFIIAGGYYSFFALLAGPYFIFLIFIIGVLGYLGKHFSTGGGGYSKGGGHGKRIINPLERDRIRNEISELEEDIEDAEKDKQEAIGRPGFDRTVQDANQTIRETKKGIKELKEELEIVKKKRS